MKRVVKKKSSREEKRGRKTKQETISDFSFPLYFFATLLLSHAWEAREPPLRSLREFLLSFFSSTLLLFHSPPPMPDQYVVPQFIDSEDKIFGPVTARQFIILMVTGLFVFLLFKLLPFVWFAVTGLPTLGIGAAIAFTRINGQPFHFFILNLVQTLKKPRLRVWDKTLRDEQLRDYIKTAPPMVSVRFQHKAYAGSSRLEEISLVVNTGGVYKPEE